MPTIDDLICDFQSAGVLDSEGRFTVSSQQAVQKLKDSQLGDPHVYALAVYRAMILSGARKVHLTWDVDDLWMDYDGPGLPFLQHLALTSTEQSQVEQFLRVGLVGAMGLEPSFMRFRTPTGGWEFRSLEQSAKKLPKHKGPLQFQLRRRLGKTFLWSLGRRLFKESRELEVLREKCPLLEIDLRFKGEQFAETLSVRSHWEWRAPEVPALRLPRRGTPLSVEPPPFPVHAVFWPHQGESELTALVAGALVEKVPLPWSDVGVALSVSALDLDLSQSQIVQNASFEDLRQWLDECRRHILTESGADSEWNAVRRREALREGSPVSRVLSEQPLFDGHSLVELRSRPQVVGRFDPALTQSLADAGVEFLNGDLKQALERSPEYRGTLLLGVWSRKMIDWKLPDILVSTSLAEQATNFEETLTPLPSRAWDRSPPRKKVLEFARSACQELENLGLCDADAVLAYLECCLLHPSPLHRLAKPHPLGELELPGGLSLRALAIRYAEEGRLDLDALQVIPQIAQRLYYGAPGEALRWQGKYNLNPLAEDGFFLYPFLHTRFQASDVSFIGLKWERGEMVCRQGKEDVLMLHLKQRTVSGKIGPHKFSFPAKQLTSVGQFYRQVEGDTKTHHYYTICFSDGLNNYFLQDRAKQYFENSRGVPDQRTEISDGWGRLFEALESFRGG